MSESAATASVVRSVLPAYIGLVILGLVVSALTFVVITDAGGPVRQAELTAGGVLALSAFPTLVYTLEQLFGGSSDE